VTRIPISITLIEAVSPRSNRVSMSQPRAAAGTSFATFPWLTITKFQRKNDAPIAEIRGERTGAFRSGR